ncbi:MAG: hypothetical protein E7355_01455 [Clostridiales bacterium]|nr:hypothetical protein [Clostridiales bacterium]
MTKFDVMEEKITRRRRERLDEEFNRRLSLRLETKTHQETIDELLGGLTVILGVGDIVKQVAVTAESCL